MANVSFKRIVADGPRNAVVELMGIFDTTAVTFSVTPAIDLSTDFVNNEIGPTLVGLRMDEIQYSLSDNLAGYVAWDATGDEFIALFAGRGKFCFEPYNGLQPDRAAAGYTGDIDLFINNIVVTAGEPIQVFTLLLAMTKLYDV